MIEVTDAIDRQVVFERAPERVISLVPSETWSVAELVGVQRIVGRTDFCCEPEGHVELIPSVGGTKGFDVAAVKALRPDLVLANKEENSRPLVEAMIADGLPVHVSFPCTVDQSNEYLVSLCLLLGLDPDRAGPVAACRAAVARGRAARTDSALPVFVPIWKDPWMTFDGGAYASDILDLCGARNVFSGRARQYPLAADLGKREPWSPERVEHRDTRYPRIRLQEVADLGARAALLPNEPYEFGPEEAEAFSELDSAQTIAVRFVDGKDLFWYGTHVARAVERLCGDVAEARALSVGAAAHK
jgi:ABC-type Fe3+-hydroxamate transport system substrate-binding protein